jgi:flagellar basal-body rod protein FlgF
MMDSVGLLSASMQISQQRMNVIANNAANALTPGFRRELLAIAGQFGLGGDLETNGIQTQATSPVAYSVVDKTPGTPRQTSNSLDLALLGEGYFEIQTSNGVAYTRQGAFRLDAQGKLVTQSGLAVSGMGGDIVLSTGTPVIDRDGNVFEKDKQVAQIKVALFDDPRQLRSIGGGLYIHSGNEQPHAAPLPRVAQGQLESSNVDSASEMVKLVETYRHFEGVSRVLQAYDDIRDKTFRSLGQF